MYEAYQSHTRQQSTEILPEDLIPDQIIIICLFKDFFFVFSSHLCPPPCFFVFGFLFFNGTYARGRLKDNHFYSLYRTSLGDQIKWAGTFNPLLQRLCAWTVTRQLWPDMIIGFGIKCSLTLLISQLRRETIRLVVLQGTDVMSSRANNSSEWSYQQHF